MQGDQGARGSTERKQKCRRKGGLEEEKGGVAFKILFHTL